MLEKKLKKKVGKKSWKNELLKYWSKNNLNLFIGFLGAQTQTDRHTDNIIFLPHTKL